MELPFALLEQVKTMLLQKQLSSMACYGQAMEDSESGWRNSGTGNPKTGGHKGRPVLYSSSLCRSLSTARRSMRDTWTWLTPSTRAARSWVMPR